MKSTSKIFVAGHKGLVGSAIVRRLEADEIKFNNITVRTKLELDLLDFNQVRNFFEKEKPEYVFLAAAKVGGIFANSTFPADFIYQNLQIQNNIIHCSYLYNVKKLLFLGSSCIYPKLCVQPIKEEYLLTGSLESTNEFYAIAKIAGIKMCEAYNRQYKCNFISVMPTNVYGIHDHFHLETSHVLPALIRKFHEAKLFNQESVSVWGSGTPCREFIYVDDLADACVFLMNHPQIDTQYFENKVTPLVNIGVGEDISIRNLALLIKKIVDYKGEIQFDSNKPDGTPHKLLDISQLKFLGWKNKTDLESGIRKVYEWYKKENRN